MATPQQNNPNQQNTRQQTQNTGQGEQQTSYWHNQYQNEPYYSQGDRFEDYEPAYRTGIEGRSQYAGQSFNEAEDRLRKDYEARKGSSTLTWENKGKQAACAAWDHAAQMASPDSDRQQSQR